MIRYRSLTAGVALAAVLASGVAFAQGPRGGGPFGGRGGPGGGPGAAVALRGLNLTDAQREQIRDIRTRSQEQTRAVHQRLAELLRKQREAVETIPVNEGLITSATQDLVQAQVDVAIQDARLNAEVWSVLTPEQQAQATKLKADRQARFDERREQRGQRRQNQNQNQ